LDARNEKYLLANDKQRYYWLSASQWLAKWGVYEVLSTTFYGCLTSL